MSTQVPNASVSTAFPLNPSPRDKGRVKERVAQSMSRQFANSLEVLHVVARTRVSSGEALR